MLRGTTLTVLEGSTSRYQAGATQITVGATMCADRLRARVHQRHRAIFFKNATKSEKSK